MFIIGIAGATGSGKTLLCENLIEELSEELAPNMISIIKEDSYYKDQSHISFEERVKKNYDHPDAFEHSLFVEHIRALRNGHSVEVPTYSFAEHNRTNEVTICHPSKVLILEGILMLHDATLREQMDLQVFVSTPLDISFIRRLNRDVTERGRTVEGIVEQYLSTARPMYYQYIRPSKEHADLIVPHGGQNRQAIEILKSYIRAQIPAQSD